MKHSRHKTPRVKLMATIRELHAASEFATFDALGRDSHVARLRAAREAAAKVLTEGVK